VSEENVERLRSALERLSREGPDAILDNVDPGIEWIADRSDMGRVIYHGHQGVLRSFIELAEGFDDFGFEVDQLIDAGNQVVGLGRMYGRGRTTGIRAEIPLGIVWSFGSDGKLVRYESFRNPAEALKAAGVED
jgi:ketosteroid isomerase-like protein